MADKAIVFVCSNPIPEIYPYAAKEAGAYIVATGRGDFPNQVNNSVCFPSILKGALLVHARKISDGMAITAAHAIAKFAENRGITPEDIIPKMTESDLFPVVAAEVAVKAVEEGLARIRLSYEEAFSLAKQDIDKVHAIMQHLMDNDFIQRSNPELVQKALDEAIAEIGR
jgi:malate dehydrogenase (oxaloacetate-decarboxylating)